MVSRGGGVLGGQGVGGRTAAPSAAPRRLQQVHDGLGVLGAGQELGLCQLVVLVTVHLDEDVHGRLLGLLRTTVLTLQFVDGLKVERTEGIIKMRDIVPHVD